MHVDMKKRYLNLLLILVAAMLLTVGCGKKDAVYPTTPEELNGLREGVLTGSICDEVAKENFPDCEISYFNTHADLCEALLAHKVDFFMLDTTVINNMVREHSELAKIDKSFYDQPIGIAASKTSRGEQLVKEFDAFLIENEEEVNALRDKWLGEDVYDYGKVEKLNPKLDGDRGTINLTVSSTSPPLSYADGDDFTGLDVELVKLFCEKNGYQLHIEGTDFGGIIAAVSSGKSDFGAGCITITEERAKSVNFTEPCYYIGLYAAVLKNPNEDRTYYTSGKDLDGARAACTLGMIDDILIPQIYPNAKLAYYNNMPDTVKAVQSNKADFMLIDEFSYSSLRMENDDCTMLTDVVAGVQKAGIVFPKGSKSNKLYKDVQEFISRHKSDGKLEEIKAKWIDDSVDDLADIEKYNPELTGENGTITIGTDPASTPISYMDENGLVGMDVEIAKLFAYEYGYDIEWFTSDFSGLIPAVASGKADFALCGIAITDERAVAVDFSDPYIEMGLYPLVAKKAASRWSLEGIQESFERTFIKENRWKMVASGLELTMKITIFSTIFGTVLGFLLYLLCRKGNKIANIIADSFSWLLSGLPMVVILMIAYYIIFGQSEITGANVAIIVFTISLMLSVYSMLKTAVKSIERGQTEGALSLGFTDFQAFSRIVLPQSMTQFVPNYMNELISLLKGTAIVGYIAVQDLTKVSDVIRARTYEAFFPLIATALIYLIVVVLITIIIKLIFRRYQPQLRSEDKILKKFKK